MRRPKIKINFAALPTPPPEPAERFREDYQAHERKEEAGGYEEHNVSSICNTCIFGFSYSCGGPQWGHGDKPSLSIHCVAPWFEHANVTHRVTSCNGYTPGKFDPSMFVFGEGGVEKAIEFARAAEEEAIEKSLAELENERDETDEEPLPGDDDPQEGATDVDARDSKGESTASPGQSKGPGTGNPSVDEFAKPEVEKAFPPDADDRKDKDDDDSPAGGAPPSAEAEKDESEIAEEEAEAEEAKADEDEDED